MSAERGGHRQDDFPKSELRRAPQTPPRPALMGFAIVDERFCDNIDVLQIKGTLEHKVFHVCGDFTAFSVVST